MSRQAAPEPAETPTGSTESVRKILRTAQSALVEAETASDAAVKVLASAQLELSAVDREIGLLRQSAEEIAGARAKQIAAALKGGSRAKIDSDERVARNAVRAAELDAERASWARAVNDLAAEARTATEAVQRAQDRVEAAVRQVLISEANSIAQQAEGLAAEALKLRVRIGPMFGAVDALEGISELTKRAIRLNAELIVNTPEFHAAKAAAGAFEAFAAALRTDAEARLAFNP